MRRTKLLNRLNTSSPKSIRVEALIYRHKVLVQRRQTKSLTKDQCYRLRTLENWYKMNELMEEARHIANDFNFKLETGL